MCFKIIIETTKKVKIILYHSIKIIVQSSQIISKTIFAASCRSYNPEEDLFTST